MFTTETISFRAGEPSNRPKGFVPEPIDGPQERDYKDVVVAFVCIEEDDDEEQSTILAEEIARYSTVVVGRKVLLVPFVHLTSRPLRDPPTRKVLMDSLAAGLLRHGVFQDRLADGYDRALMAHWATKEHKCGVAFRDSRFKQEQDLSIRGKSDA